MNYTKPSDTDNHNDWTPLYLSCIAGASTCIGAAIVFIQPRSKKTSQRIVPPGTMAFSLALAASVMVTVSIISILPEVFMDESVQEGDAYKMIPFYSMDMLCRILFIALGAILYFGLSCCLSVPEPEDLLHSKNFDVVLGSTGCGLSPASSTTEMASLISCDSNSLSAEFAEFDHDSPHMKLAQKTNLVGKLVLCDSDLLDPMVHNCANSICSKWTTGGDLESNEQKKAWRVAMLMFVSLLVHNFPEGLAVAVSALESEKLGITVTVGIMIHNIPEGIAIAIPCLAARPDKPWLSFALASISGLAEPIGAFVALLFLRDNAEDQNRFCMENVLAFVAGIMVMVALWELFPEAKKHSVDDRSYFWMGTISGVVVMALTELYLP